MADRFCKFIGRLAALAAFGVIPAAAQDYSAGKTAAQLFQSDCTACHKSSAGLAKGMDARSLTTFLREHYTTKVESAAALAAYLAAGGGAAEAKQKGQAPVAEPGPGPKPKSAAHGGEGEAKPHASVEPAGQPAEENDSAARAARPPAAAHEGVKVEEAIVRKLRFYAAARGDAKDTERLAEPVRTLEFYAGAGSPAEAIAPGEGANAAKPKPPEKKKNSASATSAAAASTPPGPAAPTTHAPSPRRPPAAVIERHTGNN